MIGRIRAGLAIVALADTFIGAWAAIAPRGFYDHLFPGLGGDWVSALGAYDEHLVLDFGQALLAIAVLLWLAAIIAERRLVQVSLIVALVQSTPHLVYHLTTTARLAAVADVASLIALTVLVALPAGLLVAVTQRMAR